MLQKDVSVGGRYLTKVGDARVQVVVVGRREKYVRGDKTRTAFEVRRLGETRSLPKLRSAAALSPAKVEATA